MIELPVTLTSTGGAVSFASPVKLGYTKNKGVYRLLVTAEDEWEGLTIRCFWHLPGGTDPASSLVQDGAVDVPASVTAHPGTGCITFEGSDGVKTVTSADLHYRVGSNSGTEDGTMPEPGTPAWEQLVGETSVALEAVQKQIGNLDDLTTKAKETLVAAINEAARTGSGGAGSMDLRVADGYVQYSTNSGVTWTNLIAVAELKGAKGDKGNPGDKGEPGAAGAPGKNGSDATVTAANIASALGYIPAAPGDIPVVPAEEISANTAARHSHANKAVIDGITGLVTADKVNAPDHTTDLVQYGAFRLAAQQIIAQIPTVPAVLPNPEKLTIRIGGTSVTYDGSTAQTVTIADGTEEAY